MKEILLILWSGKASRVATVLAAGLTYVIAADVELPKLAMVGIGSLATMLSALAGPQKTKP